LLPSVSLVLFSISGRAETINVAADEPLVIVYTRFEKECSEQLLETMKEEVASIMAPTGVDFQWRSLQSGSSSIGLSSELAVASFKGTCRIADLRSPHVDSGDLGWTYISDGHIIPFTDVDCDRVRQFISPALVYVKEVNREAALGRALGRVLAHELYHILSDSKAHASAGVAKAFFTERDLVADHFSLDERDANTLRRGKVQSLQVPAKGMRTPSASYR
jgi:hypothetical protein